MIIMSLLPGIPMLPFMALGGGAGMLAFVIQKRTRLAAVADAKATAAADPSRRRPGRGADLGGAQDRRPQDRARLRAAAAGQRAGRLGPPHRADQGAAPLARERDGLRDAGGAHPRQRAARGQRLHHQAQGSGRRPGPHLAGPAHGDGPGRRRRCSCPACTPPSRRSACRPPGSTRRSRKRPRSRATPWSMPRPCWRRTSPRCSRATCRSCSRMARCRS